MRPFIRLSLAFSFAFLITISTIAKNPERELKFTSFNSLFLYDEIGDKNKIPKNRKKRNSSDFEALRKTALKEDPDIIGFQEIENEAALKNITISEYNCKATITPGYSQEVGLCWKKNLGQPKLKEIQELSLRPGLRKGLLGEFQFGPNRISVLVVHLKAGHSSKDKQDRRGQISVLREILPTLGDFVLLGDFNENLGRNHSLWNILQGDLRLRSANYKMQSDCWQHKEGFIDYLITNLEWKKGSFVQTKFSSDDGNFDGHPPEEEGLSDHCPVSASLIVRGN
ncbi:endonuclease [Leptospira langatensis]|uniref:Endonuclease n=1 Tax=Leptospira langatensis TaxID=2484983 RepID=A0A5F1ZTC1_9LEPT|nr:endonuclease/exonuclease/phosphatase family protein [Leptospira langatensis]TGJ98976.1 endonuclease [Leptospira langatensis]TGL40456.1 endonuclease [Leptospira langatensis]